MLTPFHFIVGGIIAACHIAQAQDETKQRSADNQAEATQPPPYFWLGELAEAA